MKDSVKASKMFLSEGKDILSAEGCGPTLTL
jgi:hypothetical protein